MSEPREASQLEVTRRFLLRFADLMSNGSNAANLLLAAELLQDYASRADNAEQQLQDEKLHSANLETRLAAFCGDDQVGLPRPILVLVKSQFEAMSEEFERTGNVVALAMCQASASTLDRYVARATPPGDSEAVDPIDAKASVAVVN